MRLNKNLGLASFALAVSLATLEAKPTQAAVVNYNFTVDATSGGNPGQYFGSFSYDDSNLTGLGEESLDVSNGLLSIKFDYLGTQYTEVDDIDFPTGVAPLVSFRDGKVLGLSYLVENQFFIGGDLDNPFLGGNIFYSVESANLFTAIPVGTVTYSTVPVSEPLAVVGTAIASAVGLWTSRQKKSTQSA
ncbi:PEP-CTERM sorting domain-containing protein [Nostoc sp. MS1]|uniref:PEP-CTERM sorting domain-containing protein n=1 Tax=Nostoc sp. MS1 TaxID=2764711 RepID=UPI001CC8131C|nr:PEP-CTERM sorting domain-containing protein [Nostoc sp. MS1]BCL35751.1 hypothetical protein NSMS1_21980 [Nostoc sp. MS1]